MSSTKGTFAILLGAFFIAATLKVTFPGEAVIAGAQVSRGSARQALPCGCPATGAASPKAQKDSHRGKGPDGPILLVIDTGERTLTVYENGRPFKQYPVAVGKPSTPSPPGEWQVIKKSSWSGGFGTRWMGLDVPWGIFGIHGTNKPWSIGDAVSGGCIRMFNHHVEELFDWVKIGTVVKIVSHPYDPLRNPRRLLGPGERGADVLLVERRLVHMGYQVGLIDGVYDGDTARAVREFQVKSGLPATGEVTDRVYDALGLYLFE